VRAPRACAARVAGAAAALALLAVAAVGFAGGWAVPRLRDSFERSRASEAFGFGASLVAAQEDYRALAAGYALEYGELGLDPTTLLHFQAGPIESDDPLRAWTVRLVRREGAVRGGPYAAVFGRDGFDAARSTVPPALLPRD
jgi:hypothetical protein